MIPEPITAISTGIGLLGFILTSALNTIERIWLTKDALEEHHERLIAHKYTLRACELRLSSWYRLWFPRHGVFQDDFAAKLWGGKGAAELEDLIVQIVSAAETVKRKLYGTADDRKLPDWLLDSEERALRNGIQRSNTGQWSHLCEAVAFALWQNASPKDPIAKIKDLIQNLDTMSHDYYYSEHGRDKIGTKISSCEVLALERSERRFQLISNALRLAYEDLNGKINLFGLRRIWALLCTPTCRDTQHTLETESEYLDIEFLKLESGFETNAASYRISESLSMDRITGETEFGERLREKEGTDGGFAASSALKRTIKDLFSCLAQIPPDVDGRDTTRKRYVWGTILLRARAALGLANWMALVWNTPWLDSLCSCGVRPVKFEDGTSVAVFTQMEHQPDGCCDPEFYLHQHLLLGVVLAELALARPVCVRRCSDSGAPNFVVFHTGRRNDAEQLSSRQLIERVGSAANSSDYEAAIKYCFRLHEGLEDRTNTARASIQFEQKAVQPLRRFYEHTSKVYEKGGKAMWDRWQEEFYRSVT